MNTQLTCWCDGGTNGPNGNAQGGYARYRIGEGAVVRVELPAVRTNQEAEYGALIELLGKLVIRRERNATIVTDSQWMYRQLVGECQVRAPNIIPLYAQARHMLDVTGARLEWRARDARGGTREMLGC